MPLDTDRTPTDCTPYDDEWCPRHGVCTCFPVVGDDSSCPLHGRRSAHAQLSLV